ncbi:homocysteine S-methyltransferase, putative [Plasmodium gallinaceum]|uniref:Homocysteine S-methyltransferase, putative n=1 Tax=Plasmodium gallinaceum TaxID=5849 RepID=A0A1J1H125_PLAGA|nr:homocysteine S-methyltransferase, putative [Plasmodium gallinaceum]CRG96973.1 homocysteine S-methyltransferase, putative [Plasmodium gallinaceum]
MTKYIYTLDGGKISELERLGFNNFDFLSYDDNESDITKNEMKKILENIHLSYFLAGCNIINTNTFQVNLHSLKEKNISVEKGEDILNTYIDIAYNSLQKYNEIKRNREFLLDFSKCKNDSIYEHLENFKNIRKKLNILHENDMFNTNIYLDELKLQNTNVKKIKKLERNKNNYIAFSNGCYSSAFRDFSEYSGVFHKNKENLKDKELASLKKNNKKKLGKMKIKNNNKYIENLLKKNIKPYKNYDIKLKLYGNIPFNSKQSNIEMIPRTTRNNKNSYVFSPNVKLFNYGLEYYIDVSDEEIISNCKFKLGSFSKNSDKLNFFSLTTCSNIREVITFYNYIKYYGSTFNNNVIINFFCNSSKYIGCSDYSFFDFVSLLLYLDSYNKYIKAIGLNCVNIEYVYDLFFPFKKYVCQYNNINVDLYKSENSQMNSIVKSIMNDLKKNRYVNDVNFFCSPNKSLKNVFFDDANKKVDFQNSSKKSNHIYNFIEEWMKVNINGFGGCCFYNPYDISLIDYKLKQLS